MIKTIQRLVDIIYRSPRAKYKTMQRFGGYFNYQNMLKAQKQMQLQATKLLPIQSYTDGLSIYFLTGKNYLYQTLFCIQSLATSTQTKFNFKLVDDGTFDDELINFINKQLPGAEIITQAIIDENLNKILPASKFPILNQKRSEYAHIKKLTDIHTLAGNWKLVLDSDMMFYREPIELINWLKNPSAPLHMVDCEQSYGYSIELMEKLTGNKIQSLVNVGVLGLNSETINWKDLENWTSTLEKEEGKTYFLEQALSAMLISGFNTEQLTVKDYKVNPSNEDTLNKNGILHHYVDLSKELYFKKCWRKFLPKQIIND